MGAEFCCARNLCWLNLLLLPDSRCCQCRGAAVRWCLVSMHIGGERQTHVIRKKIGQQPLASSQVLGGVGIAVFPFNRTLSSSSSVFLFGSLPSLGSLVVASCRSSLIHQSLLIG